MKLLYVNMLLFIKSFFIQKQLKYQKYINNLKIPIVIASGSTKTDKPLLVCHDVKKCTFCDKIENCFLNQKK
jgi:hypothetical protein